VEAIADLGDRLERFWRYYGQKARTKTRDTRAYGLSYLKGLLRLKADRNMAEIAREADISEQNMQHFISNSPWSGFEMIEQVQQAVCEREALAGGLLILDESADVKYGESSAGSSRQHNGRLGKVEQSQVGVYLSYAKDRVWTLIDGELFLTEKWFSKSYAARRNKAEIPLERRVFQTKIELGWQMIAPSAFFLPPTEPLATSPAGPTSPVSTPTPVPARSPTQAPTNTPVLLPPTPTKTPFPSS
jgi:SRSO17 transposase